MGSLYGHREIEFGRGGEYAQPSLLHHALILDAHAAPAGDVDAGLDGHDMPLLDRALV